MRTSHNTTQSRGNHRPGSFILLICLFNYISRASDDKINHITTAPRQRLSSPLWGFFVAYFSFVEPNVLEFWFCPCSDIRLFLFSVYYRLILRFLTRQVKNRWLSPLFCHCCGDAGEGFCSVLLPFLTALVKPIPGYLA